MEAVELRREISRLHDISRELRRLMLEAARKKKSGPECGDVFTAETAERAEFIVEDR